jgi:hypothetical protein
MRSHARVIPAALTLAAVLLLCRPASADVTGFFGGNTTPQTRPVFGAALGGSFAIIGWEFEYCYNTEDLGDFAPAIRTYMGNVLAQNPIPINGLTFYGTVGAGIYSERLGDADSETNVGTNLGGGVKIDLTGPLRLRVDYRLFTLMGSPLTRSPQRFYVGLTLRF